MAGAKRAILKSARRKHEKVYKDARKKAKKSGTREDKLRAFYSNHRLYNLENYRLRELKKILKDRGFRKSELKARAADGYPRLEKFVKDKERLSAAKAKHEATKREKNYTLERNRAKPKNRRRTESPVLWKDSIEIEKKLRRGKK